MAPQHPQMGSHCRRYSGYRWRGRSSGRRWGENLSGPRLAPAENSIVALGERDMTAYNAGATGTHRRGARDRRSAKMQKCCVSRSDRITLALARRLGWPTKEVNLSVEIELPEDWAARVVDETPMRAEICLAVLRRGLAAGA